jgi:hypothetical protein
MVNLRSRGKKVAVSVIDHAVKQANKLKKQLGGRIRKRSAKASYGQIGGRRRRRRRRCGQKGGRSGITNSAEPSKLKPSSTVVRAALKAIATPRRQKGKNQKGSGLLRDIGGFLEDLFSF